MLDPLPDRDRPSMKQRLRRAWALEDHERALDQLRVLVRELDHSSPGPRAGDPRLAGARQPREAVALPAKGDGGLSVFV